MAWGNSPDRLYTGSSDGMVKVWDIRASTGHSLLRDLLECHGPVSCGAFSPDFCKLVVGDASGRVFVLSVDDDEDASRIKDLYTTLCLPDGGVKTIRRPRPLVRPADPPPPPLDAHGNPYPREESGRDVARQYLESGRLILTGNPVLGAVQGPNYAETGLYRRELHCDNDPSKPLLAHHEKAQRQHQAIYASSRLETVRDTGWPVVDNMDVEDDDTEDGDDDDDDEDEDEFDFVLQSLDERLRAAVLHERANEPDNNGLVYVDNDDGMAWGA